MDWRGNRLEVRPGNYGELEAALPVCSPRFLLVMSPLGYVSQGHSGWDTENMEEKRAVAEILRARAYSMKSCLFVPGFLSGFLDKFFSLNLLMFNEN